MNKRENIPQQVQTEILHKLYLYNILHKLYLYNISHKFKNLNDWSRILSLDVKNWENVNF